MNNFYRLIQGDCLKVLPTLEDESIDLVVTDPPYYKISKESWDNQWKTYKEYLTWLSTVINLIYNKLKPSGSLYLFSAFGNNFNEFTNMLYSSDFNITNMILWWRSTPGFKQSKKRFTINYEIIWFMTKDKNYTFNLDKVRVKHFQKYDPRANPKGKSPGCIWYEFNLMIGKHKEQVGHPTQKPKKLIERMINASSNENDLVCDPFMGSGTTMFVCQNLRRNGIGVEIEPKYCELIRKRCFGRTFLDHEVKYNFEKFKYTKT